MRGPTSAIALLVVSALSGCLGAGDEAGDALGGAGTAAGSQFSATSVFPGAYVTHGPYSKVLVAGGLASLPHEVFGFESPADGTRLQVGVARPDVPEGTKVPIIAVLSPYFDTFGDDLRDVPAAGAPPRQLIGEFLPHGYAVALISLRGYAGSEGCFDLLGDVDQADLDAAVTHLATQEWSNGNVGTIGLSYEGGAQWALAATGNPHVKTIVPISGFPDVFGVAVRNGTPSALLAAGGPLFNAGVKERGRAQGPDPVGGTLATAAEQTCLAGLAAEQPLTYAAATGERDPAGWFDERDHREAILEDYRGSVLLVHGLRDDGVYPHSGFPFANRVADTGVPVKMMLGQWHHTDPDDTSAMLYPDADTLEGALENPTPRWDWAEILLHWFDYWLKDDTTVDLGPRVQVADSSGAWRDEADWPPRDAAPRTFYLTPDGGIADEPAAGEGTHPLVPSPEWTPVAARGDALLAACRSCVWFRSEPSDSEWRFAGAPRLDLTVVPSGPGGVVTGYLFVEDADGLSRVTAGMIDLRFADGTEKGKAVTPGTPVVVHWELEPNDVVVPKGARLVVALAQAPSGDGDAFGLTTYLPSPSSTPALLRTGGDASTLHVNTFVRSGEPSFDPPASSSS
ncbi:MAG: CocE/NonD family hydrolase [Methanobacteriota archaeon]